MISLTPQGPKESVRWWVPCETFELILPTDVPQQELKDQSMGSFVHRPVEHHISRLVEIWQVSQPLHLRYLSIIRDAALTNGIPHFIHYSFENFKILVDEGKASWDPVITIPKEHKEFRSVAAIDAQPDLDENGFPKISNSLFQGRHNDASLAECVQGADEKLPLLAAHDPRAVRSKGGDWIIQGDPADRVTSSIPLLTWPRLWRQVPIPVAPFARTAQGNSQHGAKRTMARWTHQEAT